MSILRLPRKTKKALKRVCINREDNPKLIISCELTDVGGSTIYRPDYKRFCIRNYKLIYKNSRKLQFNNNF